MPRAHLPRSERALGEAALYASARVAALEGEADRLMDEAEAVEVLTVEDFDRAMALLRRASELMSRAARVDAD